MNKCIMVFGDDYSYYSEEIIPVQWANSMNLHISLLNKQTINVGVN